MLVMMAIGIVFSMVKTGIAATNDAAIKENIGIDSAVIAEGCSEFVL